MAGVHDLTIEVPYRLGRLRSRASRGREMGAVVVLRKLRRRLWSTRRSIAVVRELVEMGSPKWLLVAWVEPADFDELASLVEHAVGVEYLNTRPIERTRLAAAGTLSVARDRSGALLAFHFVHRRHDHEALNAVAPNMYPRMSEDEVLTEAVYCLPACRGRHIAADLLVATGSRLAAEGVQRAWAYLDTTNTSALRMFNRAGYTLSGTERVDRYRLGRYTTSFRALSSRSRSEWCAITGSS